MVLIFRSTSSKIWIEWNDWKINYFQSSVLNTARGVKNVVNNEEMQTKEKDQSVQSQSTPTIIINNTNTNTNTNTNVNGDVAARVREKNKWVAFFLCLFLGLLGVHKFYEGKIGMGILYIFTAGLFAIGWIVDLIVLITKPNPYYV